MKEYRELLKHILYNGYEVKNDRTGVGTLNVNGYMTRYDLSKGLPVVTARQTAVKGAIAEMVAFLNGWTNVKDYGRAAPFWDKWAYSVEDNPHVERGELGPIYGSQMRNFNGSGVDQLVELLDGLKSKPFSRRHIVSYWNPQVLPDESSAHDRNIESGYQVLPPCHMMFQCFVRPAKEPGGKMILDTLMYQRSCDTAVGKPANIVYYTVMQHLIAKHCGYIVGDFVHMVGSAHIYLDQIPGVMKMLETPQQETLPTLVILADKQNIWDYRVEDFRLVNYTPGPKIEMPVAV